MSETNQCDGCKRGLELGNSFHYLNGRPVMTCTKERYSSPQPKEECICEEDNKLTQAFCKLHGSPAYRKEEWEERFDAKWDGCFSDNNGDYVNPQVKDFIRTEKELSRQLALSEVLKALQEQAEPYDGAKWHNTLSFETIQKVVAQLQELSK